MLNYYKSPEENATNNFSTDVHHVSLRSTLQQIDIIHTLVEKYPNDLRIARTSAEIWDAFKSGQIASLIGVEGLHQIANSASVLRNFYRLGVRYVTLTHDSNNLYADSTVRNCLSRKKFVVMILIRNLQNSATPYHDGLSEEGIEMIREMNRIGM